MTSVAIDNYRQNDNSWTVVEKRKPRNKSLETKPVENKSAFMTREQKKQLLSSKVDALYRQVEAACPETLLEPETSLENGEIVEFHNGQISQIRYSQDSIANRTSNGIYLTNLTNNMRRSGWNSDFSIDLVKMPDEVYTSADNRRLFCAQEVVEKPVYRGGKVAVAEYDSLTITARTYHHSIKANSKDTKGMRNSFRQAMQDLYPDYYADYRFHQIPLPRERGIRPNTWGELIVLRMHSGEGDTEASPYGFGKPWIR